MWAKNYDNCKKCGTNNIPHMAKGLCASCYQMEYRKKHKEEAKLYKKVYYILNKEKHLKRLKTNREKKYFDNKRIKVLKRDKYKCRKCGSKEKLIVHHIDGNGRGSDIYNNKLNNLITLCTGCHMNAHRKDLMKARTKNQQKQWAYKYKKCIHCGTKKRKHAGKGYCSNCYPKFLRGSIKPKRTKIRIAPKTKIGLEIK